MVLRLFGQRVGVLVASVAIPNVLVASNLGRYKASYPGCLQLVIPPDSILRREDRATLGRELVHLVLTYHLASKPFLT